MSNQIIWEKWADPFGDNIDEIKWNDYDNHDTDNTMEVLEHNFKKPIRVIASPLGLIPYNEYTASGKIFNFWVGHTNFNISKGISNIIEKCCGVELLDIFTRYRFRIAIGKCFNDSEIMSIINDTIYTFLDNNI